MKTIEKVIAIVLSLLTGLTTIYNIVIKHSRKRELEYYEKILKPFIIAYKDDKDIDSISFIKNIISREDDYVPRYIFYLLDRNKSIKLKRVLLIDYYDLYKNDRNNLLFIETCIEKIVFYTYFWNTVNRVDTIFNRFLEGTRCYSY